MAKINTLRELVQFTGILESTGLDVRCIKQASGNVAKLIEGFEAQPENRAGRRVRRPVRKAVRRTLAHLASAARHVGDGSASRSDARKLIRFAGCCDDFTALECRASEYRGRHNRIVRRINDRKARETAREFWLDHERSVLEIKTVSHLRSVGKRLRNCICGCLGATYREELRDGEREFWALQCQGEVVGLLSIDAEKRTFEECLGVDNEPLGWDRQGFLELQRVLNATGDEIDEIVESGAFSLFLDQPDLRPVSAQIGKRTYQAWSWEGEIILCDDLEHWSRFMVRPGRRGGRTNCFASAGSAMDVEELVCLVAACPELAKVIEQSLPVCSSEDTPPSTGRRRRRRPRRTRRRPGL